MSQHQVPVNWQIVKLGQAFRFTQKPKGLRLSDYAYVPFVPMEFVPIGSTYFDRYSERPADEVNSGTYFEQGDVLIAKITPSFENGKQGIIESLPLPFGIATTEVIPIQDIPGVSEKRYLFYYLLRPDIRSELAGKMEGTTGRQRLSKSTLENLPIPLPPLPEQRAIAHALRTVQEAKEARRRELVLERERKAALMQHLFTHGVRGEALKETEIGPMPESWRVVRLGEIAATRRETIQPSAHPNMRYVGLEHIDPGALRLAKSGVASDVTSSKWKFYPGDVLYGKLRPYLDKVTITNSKGLCSTDIVVVRPIKGYDAEFLVSLLHTKAFLDYAIKTTSGVNHPRTSWTSLESYQFACPEPDEASIIGDVIAACENKIATLEHENVVLEELFRAMLEEVMTGRLSALPLVEVSVES